MVDKIVRHDELVPGEYYKALFRSGNNYIGCAESRNHLTILSKNGEPYTGKGGFSAAHIIFPVSEIYAKTHGKVKQASNSSAAGLLDNEY